MTGEARDMPEIGLNVDESELAMLQDSLRVFADGGNARLVPCRYGGRDYLFKQFRDEYLRDVCPSALDRCVAWRQGLPGNLRRHLDSRTAWPRCVVRQAGQLRGVLMPIAPDPYFRRRPDGRWTPRTMYDLLPSLRYRPAPLAEKLAVFGHSIKSVLWLHEQGVVVSDLHPDNILCAGDGRGTYLVDCDSMVSLEHWGRIAPPAAPDILHEVIPGDPTEVTDLAKLAWLTIAILLDEFGLVSLGSGDRRRLAATVSPAAADLLIASLEGAPDVAAWRRLAEQWLDEAEAARQDAAAARLPAGVARRSSGWLPSDFRYRPGPAPVLLPTRRSAGLPSHGNGLLTAVVLLVVAALLAVGAGVIDGGLPSWHP